MKNKLEKYIERCHNIKLTPVWFWSDSVTKLNLEATEFILEYLLAKETGDELKEVSYNDPVM